MYLGGVGLARGYLHRPDLTAEKFVPHPFSPEPGARLYRSGDLARWRGEGELEFLGRVDRQVKVRGYRIEPGEIEQALSEHPGVSEAVVVAREESPGESRLVAYVVGKAGQGVELGVMREFLQARLPSYMVPGVYVVLAALPKTAHGKIDRGALPAPEKVGGGRVAPRTALEAQMAGIWREVLGVPAVGVEDSFFELGGHSLLAMQLLSRLRDTWGVELPLQAFFQNPTVAGLCHQIADVKGGASASSRAPIVPVAREAYRVKRRLEKKGIDGSMDGKEP